MSQGHASTDRVATFLTRERPRHLKELFEFVSFASVSALETSRSEIRRCAIWLEQQLRLIGLDGVQLIETDGNPCVYGQWVDDPTLPTLFFYGHYDVQPADPIDEWTTPPFQPVVRDDAMYARGVSDNKGPIFAALKAIESVLAVHGRLPCNVKVLIDGEEELRADHLDQVFEDHGVLLAADLLVNTDGVSLAPDVPSVPIGLRGMVALEFSVTTSTSDLHSGIFGGVAPNALHVLTHLLDTLRTPDGHVLVRGFYDDVVPVSSDELAEWARLPIDADTVRRQAGVVELLNGDMGTVLERQWSLPTLDLNGVWGGFEGQGVKTVIPARAHAKLSCRLVPDQRTDVVLRQLIDHLERHITADARLTIESTLEGAPPMLVDRAHPGVRAAQSALAVGFRREAVITRLGVSVPVNEIAARRLRMPGVIIPSSSPTDGFHAVDEHWALESFDSAVRTVVAFMPAYVTAIREH